MHSPTKFSVFHYEKGSSRGANSLFVRLARVWLTELFSSSPEMAKMRETAVSLETVPVTPNGRSGL
jgi:hypothetical protein